MSDSLMEIRDLGCVLGGNRILDSISFDISDGEYLSIIGPNGAGKTTLLKCLMRIVPSWSGTVVLDGRPLSGYRQKELAKRIGYVPQAGDVLFPFTVEEFVMMGRYPFLSPFTTIKSEDRAVVQAAMETTGTIELSARKFATLSGGEKQLVFIAAVIAQGSDLLLLDEPTTFLDPGNALEVQRILADINRRCNITVVAVTHDINSAIIYGDRIIVMKEGKIIHEGEAEDIAATGILEKTYEKEFSYVKHPFSGCTIVVPDIVEDEK